MAKSRLTVTQIRSLLNPGVRQRLWRAEGGVIGATIVADEVEDRLVLVVSHVLATREEINSLEYMKLFGPRVDAAILAKNHAAEQRITERQQLRFRGSLAQQVKPVREVRA